MKETRADTSAAGTGWPSEPISVSPIEAIIESFWNPKLEAGSRWRCESGTLGVFWDACFYEVEVAASGTTGRMHRSYELQIGAYRRLRVRLRPGKGVTTRVIAEVDGRVETIVEHTAPSHDAYEIFGPVSGNRLTGLTLEFTIPGDATLVGPEHREGASERTHAVQLRWVMLETDGERWRAPDHPFEGMIASGDIGRFEPGLGLIFGSDELEQMRAFAADPMFAERWSEDLDLAAEQFRADPASMIRQYSLYADTRYGRPWDLEIDTGTDGLLIALVGLITRNEEYMCQAAKHAIVFARIDEWAEGFVDRMPDYFWYHSNFAPNVAATKASLLLDFTWHWLTPEGRSLVRGAIREKGLKRLEGAEDRMANQGVRFTKGLVLGSIAAADDRTDPALRATIRGLIEKMIDKLDSVARPDGTFSEGMGYGAGTMASVPITCLAASRCLEVPVSQLVTKRFLPAMRFVLTAEREIAPAFASFCAGPLGDALFADQCVPTGLMASYHGASSASTGGNSCEYVFYGLIPLWSPPKRESAGTPKLPAFSLFRDGGWLFLGSDDPEAPRLSFESGLWDGHGHSWYHKHAVTVDVGGAKVLLTRRHLSYEDARSRSTMCTRLYNTFAPAGRDQDATGTPGCGAMLTVAEDFGVVTVVESDNATAWRRNVNRAVRRLVFVRPDVIVIDDIMELDTPETGVQSWNSLAPWEIVDGRSCVTRIDGTGAKITGIAGSPFSLSSREDSVHNTGDGEVPAFRAAFTIEASRYHRLFTVVEILPHGAQKSSSSVRVIDRELPIVEIAVGREVLQVAAGRNQGADLSGCTTDGELLVTLLHDGAVALAGAFGAHTLRTPFGYRSGDGFLACDNRP